MKSPRGDRWPQQRGFSPSSSRPSGSPEWSEKSRPAGPPSRSSPKSPASLPESLSRGASRPPALEKGCRPGRRPLHGQGRSRTPKYGRLLESGPFPGSCPRQEGRFRLPSERVRREPGESARPPSSLSWRFVPLSESPLHLFTTRRPPAFFFPGPLPRIGRFPARTCLFFSGSVCRTVERRESVPLKQSVWQL